MPLPKPNSGEQEKDFISRCMGNPTMVSDFSDTKQRTAVCYSQWNKKEVAEVENEGNKMLELAEDEYAPLDGAQSFEELDKIEAQRENLREVSMATRNAQGMITNVMIDPNMSIEEKPNAIQKIMNGLVKRVKNLTSGKEISEPTVVNNTVIIETEKQASKTEGGIRFRSSDYAVVPDEEKPSTWKLRLAENSSGNITVAQVARAITAMQPGGFRGQQAELSPEEKSQAISRIGAAIGRSDGDDNQKKNLRTRLNRVKELAEHVNSSFWITKDATGNMRWYGFPSNKWRDRDIPAQIISEDAHKEFVEYLEQTKDYPILLSWHTPGTRIGQADWAVYEKGFLIMGGYIDSDKHTDAEALVEKCQKEAIGMSHGFVYSYADKEKEVIGRYRTWEVSHLPLSKAANVWTSIDIIRKEVKETMISEEKKAYLVGLHGQEVVDSIINKAADLEKDLLSAGVEFKDIVEPEVKEVDSSALVQETAKAIVESEGFKSIATTIAGLEEQFKELKETTIPALEQKIAEATTKAQKTTDDAIAEAMKSRSSVYQPSKDAPAPTEEENKESPGPQADFIDAGFYEAMTGSQIIAQ